MHVFIYWLFFVGSDARARGSYTNLFPRPRGWLRFSMRPKLWYHLPCFLRSTRHADMLWDVLRAPRIIRAAISVEAPSPPGVVPMTSWGTVELQSGASAGTGDLGTEVPVGGIDGPLCHEGPEDLVGLGAAWESGLRQEHQVHASPAVEVNEVHHAEPLVRGVVVTLAQQDVELVGQEVLEGLEAHPFPVLPVRVIRCLEAPQGRQIVKFLRRNTIGTVRSRCHGPASVRFVPGVMVLPGRLRTRRARR